MQLLKILGWILTALPVLGLFGLFVWILKEILSEDESVKYFIYVMFLVMFVGILLLAVAYLGEYFV